MGSSPVTAYIESATGIKEGARTGIAALTACAWFIVALFFNPLIGAPPVRAWLPQHVAACACGWHCMRSRMGLQKSHSLATVAP